MTTFIHLIEAAAGMRRRFPDGNNIYQTMTFLLEECGELAQQVNHFEGSGIKMQKYGTPDRARLVTEIRQAMLVLAQVALHYGVEQELAQAIENHWQRLVNEGWIDIDEP